MAIASWFRRRFGVDKPLIGVIHLPALPGSAGHRWPLARILARVADDARRYVDAGIDGLILENFGDAPFRRGAVAPHTVACLTRAAMRVKEHAGSLPVGVNVLRNDAQAALGIAAAADLDFVRVNVLVGVAVTDQGLIEGDAAAVLDYRRQLGSQAKIFADLRVKHATQLRTADLAVEIGEMIHRARADAMLVTGAATGDAPDAEYLGAVRRAAGSVPVLVASGAGQANLAALAVHVDGFIVGTAMKRGARTEDPVDPARAKALVMEARRVRRAETAR